MAAKVTITCNHCGAKVESTDVKEAINWNDYHDTVCPVLLRENVRTDG